MTQRLLHPGTTAAVILGASDWTESGLGLAPSFRRSAKGILSYLVEAAGLHLDPELVLDLFDDPTSASDQLARLRDTLDGLMRERRDAGQTVADVVVYYVGHGTTDERGHLSLLVKRSRKGLEAETGIRAPDLARVLRISAPQQRRFIVLDCCFSEAAVRAFVGMGAPEQAVAAGVAKDIAEEMPNRGGLLLCSSQIGEIAVGHPTAERTLFTGAVLKVFRGGVRNRPSFLSFSDLCDEAYKCMLDEYGAQAPRPVLHAINQVHGDLTRLPAFPNVGGRRHSAERQQQEKGDIRDTTSRTTRERPPSDDGDHVTDDTDARLSRRLQLISKWAYEEIIPDGDLEFVLSAALEELDNRPAALVRRVLDSPHAKATALIAVLAGIEEGTLSRRPPGATTAAQPPNNKQQGGPLKTNVPPPNVEPKQSSTNEANTTKPARAKILADIRSGQPPVSHSPGRDGPIRQQLGKYQIRGVLGRGAAGEVYDGWDQVLERRVAIKTVPIPNDPSDPEIEEALARLRREAQAAARLSHPNIVGVFDYGELRDLAYIVMEYVDGPSVKALVDKHERFAISETLRIMTDLLNGLQFSHARGVVHRDIKPGNIMLTSEGRAKIADFGIARIESSSMTQAGTILGTPAYMSPEQFMGEVVDARTDIYSSGIVLYQLLTGERPFDGSMAAIMHKALNTDPPLPSQITVTCPPAFDRVVRKAMAKRTEERFQSAVAFLEALQSAAADVPMGAMEKGDDTIVRPPTRKPNLGAKTVSPAPAVGGRSPNKSRTSLMLTFVILIIIFGAAFTIWRLGGITPK